MQNHLFWFNETENVKNSEEFWNINNIGECYIKLITHLSKKLKDGELENYFNEEENLLKDKHYSDRILLSNRIDKRVAELNSIYESFSPETPEAG